MFLAYDNVNCVMQIKGKLMMNIPLFFFVFNLLIMEKLIKNKEKNLPGILLRQKRDGWMNKDVGQSS